MNADRYRETIDAQTALMVTAIRDRARDECTRILASRGFVVQPTMLFVGKLEYEVLKTDIGIRVERVRGTNDMLLRFKFDPTTIQPIEHVELLIRCVQDEQQLLMVA